MTVASTRKQRELTRFYKFSVVGTIGAIVDFGTFNLLHSILGINGTLAQGISFCVAVTSNFIWNRFWTYPDSRSKPIFGQLVQFGIVNVIGLLIRTPVFNLLQEPMTKLAASILTLWPSNIPPGSDSFLVLSAEIIGSNLALAIAVVIVLMWNFSINRIWTYSDVE
jgi:putative flippase GtrA